MSDYLRALGWQEACSYSSTHGHEGAGMYSAASVVRSIALHVLLVPGIICVILASSLLFWWEFRRLTSTGGTAVGWRLPAAAITAGVISFVIIAVRFIVIA